MSAAALAEAPDAIRAPFPVKLQCLFKPMRYKVLHGGRAGAKSWGVARALLVVGFERQVRVLCAREYQSSIKESVKQLLENQIIELGLQWFYRWTDDGIFGLNGTTFGFEGLHHNILNLKSWEGADICWVEEAAVVTNNSWDILIPTIRKDGSEIWITFNEDLETDPTYKRFVVKPPANAVVVKMSWRDNPWFNETLRKEKDECKERDPDGYENIWEGHPKVALEGAVYKNELRALRADGRICRVAYNAEFPVETFWDLGWADNVSVWCAQFVGLNIHVIDHFTGSRRKISEYVADLQERKYVLGEYWIPHDGEHGTASSEGKSVGDIMRALGLSVRVVPRAKHLVAELDKVRTIFPLLYFDEAHCTDGLNSLRRYVWDTEEDGHTKGRKPLHNDASHDADALRTLGAAVDLVSHGSPDTGYRRRERSWKTR